MFSKINLNEVTGGYCKLGDGRVLPLYSSGGLGITYTNLNTGYIPGIYIENTKIPLYT